jgi:hypothetical protein
MTAAKKTKKKSKGSSSGGGAQEFLVWHGEKIAVCFVAVIALWFAMQGLGYKSLTWQPEELEKTAGEAKTAIEASTRDAEAEIGDFKIIDYSVYAEQIKKPINVEPYSTKGWNPIPGLRSSGSSPASGGGASSEDYGQ